MRRELARLAERRQRLVAQATAQRVALARELAPWHPRLALVDRGIAAVRYVRRHPAWLAGAVLVLASLRPRGARKLLQRGWLAWQIGRRLRGN